MRSLASVRGHVPDALFLYEELVNLISELVDKGTLAPGARVPSLREISHDRGVSLSTALQAYRLLEDRGVIEARPKSGFYVARHNARVFAKPAISAPPGRAVTVSVSNIVLRLRDYASDPKLIPLGCAIPSSAILATSRLDRFLARAVRNKGSESNTYNAPKGDLGLRTEIARRSMRWGQTLSPEDIVITFGGTEALSLALRSVVKAGQTVAVESPTYFGLLQTLQALNIKALELPTDATTGVDIMGLERALSTRNIAACLFASSFSNPLGCTMPDAKKRAALKLLAKYDVPLIEDDIYGDLYYGKERPKPYSAIGSRAHITYCGSFSKTVAPGYRIGWIATTHGTDVILERKLASTGRGSAILQIALADFLASGGYGRYLRSMRVVLQTNLNLMTCAVNKSFPEHTKITQPAGGFVLWLELSQRVNTRVLFDAALEEGICFAPGDVFSTSERYNNCLRLSYAQLWDARLERGIRRVGELAKSLAQR